MKKRCLLILLSVVLASPFSLLHAADGDYWQQLKERLSQLAPQKTGTVTTAVGGVRGSKDQSADTLYWKDEAVKVQVGEEEYTRFSAAYQAAIAGDKEKALNSFREFVNDYPQSSLKEEALTAIAVLQKP